MATMIDPQIRAAEWVPPYALSSAELKSRWTNSTQHVFALSDELKMIDAHTSCVAADVIEDHACWHRPSQQRPDPAMRHHLNRVDHRLVVAIAFAIEAARGDIARSLEVDFLKQALGELRVGCGWHAPKDTSD